MLHDLDKTLENILVEQGRLNRSEIDISFEQPNSEWSSQLNQPTINCWCFDMRENVKLRHKDVRYQLENSNARKSRLNVNGNAGRSATLSLPPMRLDLTYLVTAWARKIEDEHRLLWRALAVFARSALLDPADGVGSIKDQPYDIPLQVALKSENMGNFSDLWSVLDNQMRLGFTLQLTIALDLQRSLEVPFAFESIIAVGQRSDPNTQVMTPDMEIVRRGQVVDGDETVTQPVQGTRLATDYERGKYRPVKDEDDTSNDNNGSADIIQTWLDQTE